MTLSAKYIPLDRQFAEFGDAEDVEDLALRSYIGFRASADRRWEDNDGKKLD